VLMGLARFKVVADWLVNPVWVGRVLFRLVGPD
jgi:hypothetical protein